MYIGAQVFLAQKVSSVLLVEDIEQSKTLEYSGWAISVADPFIPPQLQEKVMEVLDEAGLLKEGLKDVWEKSDSEDDEETEKDR